MCKLKSVIITKDDVFCPDYDSHDQMLRELKIEDTMDNAERLFVRAEISPTDDDPFQPFDKWSYKVDQDILPDWYVKKVDKERAVAVVRQWAEKHIFAGKEIYEIASGDSYYIKDCKVDHIFGSATVKNICGSATVNYIGDSATVKNIYGSAIVRIYNDISPDVKENAVVEYPKRKEILVPKTYTIMEHE